MIAFTRLLTKTLRLESRLLKMTAERDKLRSQVQDLRATLKHLEHENNMLHREYITASQANRLLAQAHTDMVQKRVAA